MKQRTCPLLLALATIGTTTLAARTVQQDATSAISAAQTSSTDKPCQQNAKVPQLGIDPLQEVIDAMTIEEKVYLLVGAGTSATDLEARPASWFRGRRAPPFRLPAWGFRLLFLPMALPDCASPPPATALTRHFMQHSSRLAPNWQPPGILQWYVVSVMQ